MIRAKKLNDTFGCGFNKRKYAGDMRHCIENGLDYSLYRMGAKRIRRYIEREYKIKINIAGKTLDELVLEAQAIEA